MYIYFSKYSTLQVVTTVLSAARGARASSSAASANSWGTPVAVTRSVPSPSPTATDASTVDCRSV